MAKIPQPPQGRRQVIHPLAGSSPTDFIRTLLRHKGVSKQYLGQACLTFLFNLLRSPFILAERIRVGCVDDIPITPPPLFIIGHWRSGTTFLHNLMSRDSNFCFPTITDAFRPYDFLPSPFEPISRAILLAYLPDHRPMDDIPILPESPQEDELAIASMGGPSFLNTFYFPKQMQEIFRKEVLFEDSPDLEDLWKQKINYYLRKLADRCPGQRLLIKNPAHSARLPQLIQQFPDAKFIHIHRDPADVLVSTKRMYLSMLPLMALQNYELDAIDRHISSTYQALMDRLLSTFPDIPASNRVQIRYSDLIVDPLSSIGKIYGQLGLDGFGAVKSAITDFANKAQRPLPRDQSHWTPSSSPNLVDLVERYRLRLGYDNDGAIPRLAV